MDVPLQFSIHALLAESDCPPFSSFLDLLPFLSTLSLRRATVDRAIVLRALADFLSTLSLRRATVVAAHALRRFKFSIHALLAESDRQAADLPAAQEGFSIHALLAESDAIMATVGPELHFSIHALLAESDDGDLSDWALQMFSIHALLAESDASSSASRPTTSSFLSTLSLRRATWRLPTLRRSRGFFYPRSPCGERHSARNWNNNNATFLSTLSLRRATEVILELHRLHAFSIHALLAESDSGSSLRWPAAHLFYPRSPCGERL